MPGRELPSHCVYNSYIYIPFTKIILAVIKTKVGGLDVLIYGKDV